MSSEENKFIFKKAAVIGAGLIGKSWSIVFARAGISTVLFDIDKLVLNEAPREIENQVEFLKKNGLCDKPSQIISKISYSSELHQAIKDTQYIQECGPENLEIRKNLIAKLDNLADLSVPIASSTSFHLASEFSSNLNGKNRILVAHPVNPPHLIPFVEISPSKWTSKNIVRRTKEICLLINQKPIELKKEVPGFVLNRLQGALLEEAIRLYQSDICNLDDIDTAVREGLGLRWSFMGPFETIDLNAPGGLSDYMARFGKLYAGLLETGLANAEWTGDYVEAMDKERRSLLPKIQIKDRQKWRDRTLTALIAFKRKKFQEFKIDP